ncbi:MarR family transcriptional regulator [Methanocella arvoryzae]|uniref:Uncharacterized protein n=1 Tax=Methanocella arvoryzae (strain DSM 22066 / NBRC 105507 / MRE50) TaxID=351160 RepID=Q0W4T7_METAR|nr:helix-turn-helix domain-containing protein [Methanocella arvoryzae]CAJ36606.1 conserved hypothetical protein [Methanocella arvoryzae MRE50]
MRDEDQVYREIRNFMVHQFGLRSDTNMIVEQEIGEDTGPVRPDLILDDGCRRYYVEIAPKSGLNKVSQLALFKELLKADNNYRENDRFILLYKTMSSKVEDIAEKVGITPVRAPLDLKLSVFERSGSSQKVKMTTRGSWKVIYYLLRHGPASIKQVSKCTGVSYGWAHAVITGLADQGLAVKEYDSARITDQTKLFNGIAWERPLESLKIAEVAVVYDKPYTAAREISHNLKDYGIKCAFNSFTAGGLYTGRVIRHDMAYMYLKKDDLAHFKDMFARNYGGGLKVKIYTPDRDVFSDATELESVTVTSPEQTLLDLAGIGYGSVELTKAMAEYHETQ